jgi:hypothetical protein
MVAGRLFVVLPIVPRDFIQGRTHGSKLQLPIQPPRAAILRREKNIGHRRRTSLPDRSSDWTTVDRQMTIDHFLRNLSRPATPTLGPGSF